jgi:hypothetical protein
MRKRLVVLGACGTIALVGAAVVLANSGSISDPKSDTTGNPQGNNADYDIVKATFGHAPHGALVHRVTVAGHIGDPQAHGFSGSLPRILINVPHHTFSGLCDYRVDSVPPGAPGNSSNEVKYFVFKCSNGPNQPKTGGASATQTSPDTIKIVFRKRAIGSPTRYGWAVDFIAEGSNGFYDVDRSPNAGYKEHVLR